MQGKKNFHKDPRIPPEQLLLELELEQWFIIKQANDQQLRVRLALKMANIIQVEAAFMLHQDKGS